MLTNPRDATLPI